MILTKGTQPTAVIVWGLGELGSSPKSLDSLNTRAWIEWSLVPDELLLDL